MFRSTKIFVAALLAVSIINTPCGARDEIRCSVLQQKLNRLYFPVGTEAHIYRNAPFAVLHDGDTLFLGTIEHSFEGVSVSRPVGSVLDSVATDSLQAIITTARIDRFSPITIGVHGMNPKLVMPDQPDPHLEVVVREIVVHEYDDHESMFLDFESGLLDGCFSFESNAYGSNGIYLLSNPYPYIAALIPNIARPFNQQGSLTTSLFYRFDSTRLGLYFDGDDIAAVNSFVSAQEDSNYAAGRLYRHDPSGGRSLFQSLPDRPQTLNLYISDSALSPLAAYFGDILARDHCPVQMITDRRAADLYLEFVSVDDSLPSASVYALYNQLTADSVAGTQAAEKVRIIDGYFRSLMVSEDRSQYFHFLNLAQHKMTADLGVFPLFRPTTFFHAQTRLQGVSFDHKGRLDLSYAYLLVLPDPPDSVEMKR